MDNLKIEINKLSKALDLLERKANNLNKVQKDVKNTNNNDLKAEFLQVREKVSDLIKDLDKL
ncbi:MAG: hypothetical protein CMN37_08530 [SAR116 cluster bacterium]|nr:hypothetical protein [SAR116 cluster bacterium]